MREIENIHNLLKISLSPSVPPSPGIIPNKYNITDIHPTIQPTPEPYRLLYSLLLLTPYPICVISGSNGYKSRISISYLEESFCSHLCETPELDINTRRCRLCGAVGWDSEWLLKLCSKTHSWILPFGNRSGKQPLFNQVRTSSYY